MLENAPLQYGPRKASQKGFISQKGSESSENGSEWLGVPQKGLQLLRKAAENALSGKGCSSCFWGKPILREAHSEGNPRDQSEIQGP